MEGHLGLLVEDHLPKEDRPDHLAEDRLHEAAHRDHLVEDHLDHPAGDHQNVEGHLVDQRKDHPLADLVAADHLSAVDLLLADPVAADHRSVEDHLAGLNVGHPADLSVDHQSDILRIISQLDFTILNSKIFVNSKSFSVDLRPSNFQVELVQVH